MRLGLAGEVHLSYCTNIHPGESWSEVRSNLERYLLLVRARVAPGARFGVGLRLSARAARELSAPGELDRFQGFLELHGLYVFTINGFPYGAFHGTRVKEEVYRPDWLEEQRVEYSNLLASLLASLLPADLAEGTVSTVPGAFQARMEGGAAEELLAENLRSHLVHLHRLHERTGRRITLALEPEPACHLETTTDARSFLERRLLSRDAIGRLMVASGLARGAAETLARGALGVCFDTCHVAVELERPREALRALASAGIRVPKLQLSAGLAIELGEHPEEHLRALEPFAEGVYLHQVVERGGGRVRRFVDLPDAIAAVRGEHASLGRIEPREWRVHFHVPVFRERLGPFANTQRDLAEVLEELRAEPAALRHLEVETYTWEVLPEEHRRGGVVADVARELQWVLDRVAPVEGSASGEGAGPSG